MSAVVGLLSNDNDERAYHRVIGYKIVEESPPDAALSEAR